MALPAIHVLPEHDRRLRGGSPWVFANEIRMDAAAKGLAPGTIARLMMPTGKTFGLVHFNPHSLIAARLLTRNKDGTVDRAFLARRIDRALALREQLYHRPHYRLVHAEGDGLPGLVVDRFGDIVVVQINTAGMEKLAGDLVAVLDERLRPRVIVLRGDSPVRELEGLAGETRVVKGALDGPITVQEGGLGFFADALEGQKTGWFFDQADNRGFAARLGKGRRVVDLYAHSGAFALRALAAGATEAIAVDRSAQALDLARMSAEAQAVSARLRTERAEIFHAIDGLVSAKERFGLVIADPPAFVKSKKDLKPGLRGYRKLARGATLLVAEGGFLAIACCSHNVDPDAFAIEVHRGLRDAGRGARLIRRSGAGPDHPVHPSLPETAYLKFLAFALD